MKAVFGIALYLATSGSAHAQAPGEAPVKLTVELTDPSRPVQPRRPTFRPEVDVDDVLSIDGLKGTIRAEQEQVLADLIASTPDREVEEKSNYYFMLGELQAKQHRFWRLKSAELASQAARANNARTRQEATAAAEKAKQYLAKAVKTYQALTDNQAFRNYPKLDTALFYYGYTLQGAGHPAEARKVYHRLLKDHPTSKHAPEAYLAFAEHFFDAAELANAEAYYKQVQKFPRSAASRYATYKLGWIHYDLQRFQDALESFFLVAQATKNDPQQEPLSRGSVKGFILAYAEIGKPDRARPAFQRIDGKRAVVMLELLGEVYLAQGKPDRAIVIYQDLRATEPDHPNACQWRYDLARATAYNATTPRDLEICPGHVESLRDWGRANGVTVMCASCPARRPRP